MSDESILIAVTSAHVVLTVVALIGLHRWLPTQGVSLTGRDMAVVLVLFALPIIGPIGATIACIVGLTTATPERTLSFSTTRSPRLPHKPPELEKNLKFASGGLIDILRHSSDIAKRTLAVTAASRMSEKEAIPLLKIAMSDAADEVRLLAFSVRDKIESGINQRIKQNQALLQNTGDANDSNVYRALAFLHWELVYLELVEGEIKRFMLEEASRYATQALEQQSESSLLVLLGRIRLAEQQPEAAIAQFERAIVAGAEPENVATYLAEARYLLAEFPSVRQLLADMPLHLRDIAPFKSLVDRWSAT